VPIGINLLLDQITAAKVTSLLPDRQRSTYPPHSRLATYNDEVDQDRLIAGLTAIIEADPWPPLSIGLVAYGVFPGDPSIVWALPVPIHQLLDRHRILDAGLLAVTGRQSFEHGGWLPDIDLGMTEFPADAIEALAADWHGPVEGTLCQIEVVRYRRHEPIDVIFSRRLNW
jgi:hypothetical protein